eukprot:COSAG02_NODE_457_length_21950_cov_35.452794_10_plen_400_part_00
MTGLYTFYIAADDGAALHFGPTEAEAPVIATVPGWAARRQWNKYSSQVSSPQHLEAGKFYYVRGIVNEAGGGDNLAIGVTLPDGTDLKPLPVAGYVFVEPMLFTWVDVVALGAVPDGVTDSSAAFLNASAQTQLGGEIVVPTGRYRTSAFNLSSNTRLVIHGEIHGIPSRIPRDYSSSTTAWQPERSDQALIGWASDAQNISIVGNGSISNRGNGWTTNRVGFVCPHFAAHNLPSPDNAAGLEQLPHYDAIECGPSDRQRAALFAPLDFEAPPVTAREWRPSRGQQRNAAATYSEPQPEPEPQPQPHPRTYTYLFDGCCRGELDPLEARSHGFSTRTGCEATCNEMDDCVAIEVNGCLGEPISCGGTCWTFHATTNVNYSTIVNGQCVTTGDQRCYERP